eukprot:s8364_g1.t1
MRRETAQLKLRLSEHASASAGIVPSDVRVVTLENEIQAAHLEMSTLRAWNRQLDDAFNEEVNVAAQYAATANQPRLTSTPQTGSNLPPGDGQRSVGDRPSGSNLPPGDGSTRNLQPGGDPPGDDPPDDDGPPGLPSIRSTTIPDDASSFTAATNVEPPRVSRREADKVYVSPWPKQQNLGYQGEKPTRFTSAHGPSNKILVFGLLISSRVYALQPMMVIEQHGKRGYNQHYNPNLTWTLSMTVMVSDINLLMPSSLLHSPT